MYISVETDNITIINI